MNVANGVYIYYKGKQMQCPMAIKFSNSSNSSLNIFHLPQIQVWGQDVTSGSADQPGLLAAGAGD